jgi:hypothetical protein
MYKFWTCKKEKKTVHSSTELHTYGKLCTLNPGTERPESTHTVIKDYRFFPSTAGMSLTELSLARRVLNYSRPGGEFG